MTPRAKELIQPLNERLSVEKIKVNKDKLKVDELNLNIKNLNMHLKFILATGFALLIGLVTSSVLK